MIKAIATDMDGTFLNSQSTYDQARFLTVYAELKRRGIAFIVASGNPVYQLQKTFAPVKDGTWPKTASNWLKAAKTSSWGRLPRQP